jgi:hypothetical protein
MTTWLRPDCSSSGRKFRPCAGATPNTEKKLAVTPNAATRSGSPLPVKLSVLNFPGANGFCG